MADEYTLGTPVTVSATFRKDGALADPTSVTLRYRRPRHGLVAGTAEVSLVYGTDAEVQRDSEGSYSAEITPNAVGVWAYRWEGTGTVKGATEGSFRVVTTYR